MFPNQQRVEESVLKTADISPTCPEPDKSNETVAAYQGTKKARKALGHLLLLHADNNLFSRRITDDLLRGEEGDPLPVVTFQFPARLTGKFFLNQHGSELGGKLTKRPSSRTDVTTPGWGQRASQPDSSGHFKSTLSLQPSALNPFFRSIGSWLHSHAVEVRGEARRIRVRVGRRARLSGNADGQRLESRQRPSKVCAPLQGVTHSGRTLPSHSYLGAVDRRCQQAQGGKGAGGLGEATPFLPVVQTIFIAVGVIRRTIGGQAVLLQPRDKRRMELVGSNIHGAADDAREAAQIDYARGVGVVAGVDASGVGLQPQIAPAIGVQKQRVGVEVAQAAGS